ncbi:hypothetical protein B5X24_HaOG206846 [Helicoverpa armigera]|uniref:Uncharacterized protein n=1 Tax=Helicoverpa armigera TaxID=29058 RepID=A0A2W1BL63_HELAM|nr:hypothetical protein B5X24_HaOG206846 [Helicoverpa armigera]
MALTAAERAKRYREKLKLNAEKFEVQRQKQLARLKRNRKKVADLTEEEKTKQRKIWRDEKRKSKLKKCNKENIKPTKEPLKTETHVSQLLQRRYKNLRANYKKALDKIQKLHRMLETSRKRYYREKFMHERTNREIEKLQARQEVLECSLKTVYKNANTQKEKRLLKNIALNENVKANKSVMDVTKYLGLKSRIRNTKKKLPNSKIQNDIETFYNREDISRCTAGKHETRTRGKQKMQIRYLTDTFANLYDIYKKEGGKYSFTTFFRYKPFYILSPTIRNRDTCLCIKHSNIENIFIALKKNNILCYTNLEEIITQTTCNKKSYNCMFGKCNNCKTLDLQYKQEKMEDDITWFKWERVSHTYIKSGKTFVTKKIAKQQKKGIVKTLVSTFIKEFPLFKSHIYNWRHQQSEYLKCINGLHDNEIAILCDFSENYECKLGTEIQAMHFGASKSNITLHCGIIYFKGKSQSFVTISNNTCHEPNAIWAHLLPVLKFAKQLDPNIEIIHFFSDGPCSQYRQKKNFYLINLFANKTKACYTWSFSESGHGKGVADGIGGAVKRQLDKHVAYGKDIKDAEHAYQHLNKSMQSVKCFLIADNDITNMKHLIPDNIRPVPETMKLHQIMSGGQNTIFYRQLSCFCGDRRGLCDCHSPKIHKLLEVLENTYHASAFQTHDQNLNLETDQRLKIVGLSSIQASFTEEEDVVQIMNANVSLVHSETKRNDCLEPIETDDSSHISEIISVDPSVLIELTNVIDLEALDVSTFIPQNDILHSSYEQNLEEPSTSTGLKHVDLKNLSVPKKRAKIMSPVKTVVPRYFLCHLCKIPKFFVPNDMTRCIACKNWVCSLCCGHPSSIDYICDICYGSE